MNIDTTEITRVTVVTDNGRALDVSDQRVRLEVQDDGATLKVFCKSKMSFADAVNTFWRLYKGQEPISYTEAAEALTVLIQEKEDE